MPFFQRPLSKDFNKKRSVTLQVRIPLEIYGLPVKRVLSFASPSMSGTGSREIGFVCAAA